MTKSTKKTIQYPTDFAAAQLFFEPIVAALSAIDIDKADAAYTRLAKHIYNYGKKLKQRNAVSELSIYLCRRDRTANVLDMDEFQLGLALAMPGRFPPLNFSMRSALALKLAYAQKNTVKLNELGEFLTKLPPVKKMKDECAVAPAPVEREDGAVAQVPFKQRPSPTKLKRPAKRKPVTHRLKGSSTHKAMKAAARANRKHVSEG